MKTPSNRRSWMCSAAVIGLLGWGVLSLGAARPWGYVPLIAGMTMYGAITMLFSDGDAVIGRGLILSLGAFCGAIFLQLLPMPADLLRLISPTTASITKIDGVALHSSISIDSRATALGFFFALALVLFFLGTVRTMGSGGARRLATGLIGLGAFIALIGIVETSTSWAGVYRTAGLPLPPDSMPHGPFSSKNHFAGWMLMTLAVTIGQLCASSTTPNCQVSPVGRGWPAHRGGPGWFRS